MSIRSVISSFVMLLATALPLAAAERADVLRAINWVENPTNHTRRGPKGELGPYQFRSDTWRMHTRAPFSSAVQREQADEVAEKHYEWIRRGLAEAGIDANPFNIALAWNSGLGAVVSGRVPAVSYNYAGRVQNLVEAQHAERRAFPVASADVTAQGAEPVAPLFAVDHNAVRFAVSPAASRYALPESISAEVPVVYTKKPEAVTGVRAFAVPVVNVEEKPSSILPAKPVPSFALIQ